ncbi:MAG: tRNA (cytidine(34)-2'-O)-methyltransferase [Defluviitaleaceae bacterium]|nr:tRNA (cytidine(34)-2'-O)-methyltransferase [Defluviitaleaceae bacterium]
MNIVLYQPEIPQNTGNIARTCLLTNTALHLIHPLGFKTDEKSLVRSGLDYWQKIRVSYYDNFAHFVLANNNPAIYMCETGADNLYTNVQYPKNAFVMFGRETTGIPEDILQRYKETAIRIPMVPNSRSLNLSNAVAIVIYEALRQQGFAEIV